MSYDPGSRGLNVESSNDTQINQSTHERIVELLNAAALLPTDAEKCSNLKIVQELIIHKEPALLDNFVEEMVAFQTDKSVEVKKTIVGFIEEACKNFPENLPKLLPDLLHMMQDANINILKRIMLGFSSIYGAALQWVASAKNVTSEMEQTWINVQRLKDAIGKMVESDNDGIRTFSIKFLEVLTLMLTRRTSDSEVPKSFENIITLDKIPDAHPYLILKMLEEDGLKSLETISTFMGSPHLSSINLTTCMNALTNITKQRPQFMKKTITAYEMLHVNLPPTLAKSHVTIVRKNLKGHMLTLLKLSSSYDQHSQIATLLTDLGVSQSEISKNTPKVDERRKRKLEDAHFEKISAPLKKIKSEILPLISALDDDDDDDGIQFNNRSSTPINIGAINTKSYKNDTRSAIDITAEDLVDRLTPQNVADLVLLSMVPLPSNMPAQFQATYTPIAAAGTPSQIQHLSRLLATQLTAAKLGQGYEVEMERKALAEKEQKEAETIRIKEEEFKQESNQIISVVGASAPQMPDPPIFAEIVPMTKIKEEIKEEDFSLYSAPKPVPPPKPIITPISKKGIKMFKLESVTNILDQQQIEKLSFDAFNRILKAEKISIHGDISEARMKILMTLVSQYGGSIKDEMQKYIFSDLRNRADIALAWVYQEYGNYQSFNASTTGTDKNSIASYDDCLTRLLNGLLERPDQKEGLFSRLLLEAPLITDNAIIVLRKYCQDENRIFFGMSTLKELILKRPTMKLHFLDVLLQFTTHERPEVRDNAVRVAIKLHENRDFTNAIERSAIFYLKFLLQPKPQSSLFINGRPKSDLMDEWTEETIKLCLYLFLELLPVNHQLIHELASVYTAAPADIKRTILRVLEIPVKRMGMQSPELLLLVETCPKGAETLVTRIIHILTDKVAPSQELVERVRDLYQKRVPDVRFLIPVLNGLSNKEVVIALPKLIKLNPVVVKEVFNRLLVSFSGGYGNDGNILSPLSPAELLVALHNIDNTKCDMKTIIRAINMCFQKKNVYTQEILAMVVQELMEQTPLPTLFMRTVIQSLSMYPELIGFVLNILKRLIGKQVWKNKKVWEGFVKCCERIQPQSYQILFLLPAEKLKSVFEVCPGIRESMLQHISALTSHQRAHITKAIINVIEKDPKEEKMLEKNKKDEADRMASQERLYQMKIEDEKKKLHDSNPQDKQESSADETPTQVSSELMEQDEIVVPIVKPASIIMLPSRVKQDSTDDNNILSPNRKRKNEDGDSESSRIKTVVIKAESNSSRSSRRRAKKEK